MDHIFIGKFGVIFMEFYGIFRVKGYGKREFWKGRFWLLGFLRKLWMLLRSLLGRFLLAVLFRDREKMLILFWAISLPLL